MHCKKIKNELIEHGHIEGIITEPDILEHLESCVQCQAMIERLNTLPKALQSLSEENIPVERRLRMWPRVAESIEAQKRKWYHPYSVWTIAVPSLATAAILLMLFNSVPATRLSCPDSTGIVIENARIDGENARLSVSQAKDPQTTMIWLD